MKEGLTLVELIVALTIISVFIGTLLIFIRQATVIAKETTLQHSLKNLRSSLVLYKAIKEKHPEDLRELIETEYRPQGSRGVLFGEKFLSVMGRDSQGYPVDPFGNRFYYSPKSGIVKSVTEDYQNW